ncbi:hypothetical protein L1049_028315 [Liquidambar formosana]|uniref:Uncharacterized protein n=1 Tax=Liquidambar formosana TaxID=63359 RepID=A0AAP0WT70_LIQFO
MSSLSFHFPPYSISLTLNICIQKLIEDLHSTVVMLIEDFHSQQDLRRDSVMKFASFETIVELLRKYAIPAPKRTVQQTFTAWCELCWPTTDSITPAPSAAKLAKM